MNNREYINSLKKNNDTYLATENDKPSLEQVKMVISDLINVISFSDTQKKLALSANVDAKKRILDIVATFGTWLTHSEGKSEASIINQIDLPTNAKAKHGTNLVVIPKGYEIGIENKRDVSKALGRIVSSKPSEEVIVRFYSRTYQERSSALDYPMIANVWGFATRDRLKYINKVSDDSKFLQQVVSAYELLDDGIKSARSIIEKYINKDEIKLSEKVIFELNKIRWISEIEVSELKENYEMSKLNSSLISNTKESAKRFKDRLPFLLTLIPNSVEDLNAGQVKRIVQGYGIQVDQDAETRALENEIRAKLKNLKLSGDMDKLLPEAVRAAEKSSLEEFWSILENRLDGDPTWHEQIQDLLV